MVFFPNPLTQFGQTIPHAAPGSAVPEMFRMQPGGLGFGQGRPLGGGGPSPSGPPGGLQAAGQGAINPLLGMFAGNLMPPQVTGGLWGQQGGGQDFTPNPMMPAGGQPAMPGFQPGPMGGPMGPGGGYASFDAMARGMIPFIAPPEMFSGWGRGLTDRRRDVINEPYLGPGGKGGASSGTGGRGVGSDLYRPGTREGRRESK